MLNLSCQEGINVENVILVDFKEVNFDNDVFQYVSPKINKEVYYICESKCCLIVHFLWKMNYSYHVTFQGSRMSLYKEVPFRLQWDKNNIFQFWQVRIATMSQSCTKFVIFFKYLLIIRSKKKRLAKAGVFQRMFWFRSNIIVPLVNLRML